MFIQIIESINHDLNKSMNCMFSMDNCKCIIKIYIFLKR